MKPESDYVIVGGGSAGAALAARLSENPSKQVLLLEAGCVYQPNFYPEVLANASRVGGDAAHDWGYQAGASPIGRSIHAVRGKALGGSSTVNACIALRPKPSDFDKWVHLGLPEWSFAKTLESFKKLETTPDGDDALRGRCGPMAIRTRLRSEYTPSIAAFIEGAAECGHARIEHFNGTEHEGVGPYSLNVVNGVRENTGIAYLTGEVRARSNLSIQGRVEIDTVNFESGKHATGVTSADGRVFKAREVILSAGTYGSACILMRSGIGPAMHLQELGIPVLASLPVGETLKDHPFAYNIYALKHGLTAMQPAAGALVWTRSHEDTGEDLDIHISATHVFDPANSPTGGAIVLAVGLVQPDSVGWVKLRSRHPKDPPLIELNFLKENRDRRRLIEGMRKARAIGSSPAFKAVVDSELAPGVGLQNDDEISEYFHQALDTYHHPTMTVPMGRVNDGRSVVDAWGRVHGVRALRVIDASIIPEIPSVPTAVTTMMLVEHIYTHSLSTER